MNYDKLHEELTEAFINYQYNLDNPFPSTADTKCTRIIKYQSDNIFHNKVAFMVAGVIQIVQKVNSLDD